MKIKNFILVIIKKHPQMNFLKLINDNDSRI